MSAHTPTRPRPSPLPASAALALCWYCDAAADRIDPPGWVTVGLSREPGLTYTAGICPACLAARHGPPTSRRTN
jgi:hypothetical protein